MSALRFDISACSASCGARVGRVTTPHGSFDTPAFMPVGTKAAVKGLLPQQVAATGARIILNNTYHLMLRPGSELIAKLGGVHRFMAWDGPILTDSGGFQVYSLTDINRITDEGVVFRSHIDGARIELTPQRSMQVQHELGADIIMAFDDCPPSAASGDETDDAAEGPTARHAVSAAEYPARNRLAAERTWRWLDQCVIAHSPFRGRQALFGIVQGGVDLDLRTRCVEQAAGHDLPGYAIGGCAVGEGHEAMMRVVRHTAKLLPAERPRYLMGVGYERDIVEAVRAGVDMFDCVLPTRNGRNGLAFTPTGPIRLKNACFADDPAPVDTSCDCPACGRFSRAYLRHLFLSGEMLGPILLSLHNLRHFQRLLLDIRQTVCNDDWPLLWARWPVLGMTNV